MVERFGIKYNHEQEFQADEAAYDVMMFLNAKPDAYVSALTKIRNYLYRTGNHLVLKDSHTHPSLDSRLEKLAVIPKEFYSDEYQRIISFVNTNNAKIEYSKKHFLECENLVDKNINAGVGTESDYILKALVTRVMHGGYFGDIDLPHRLRLKEHFIENDVRGFAVGRCNYMFCGNHDTAENAPVM